MLSLPATSRQSLCSTPINDPSPEPHLVAAAVGAGLGVLPSGCGRGGPGVTLRQFEKADPREADVQPAGG